MWGYDSGVIGGVLSLDSFKEHFNVSDNNSSVQSTSVSLLQAGGFFGALMMSPICKKYGRKWSMFAAAGVFIVGAIMQTAGTGGLGLLYAGRVVAGLGVGGVTMVVPTYVAEIVPPSVRGVLMGSYQFFIVTGVTVSYWVDYGCKLHISNKSTAQWRLPLGLQMIFPGMLMLGTLALKESPRWLATKGDEARAINNLAWMRNLPADSPEVQAEFQEIHASIIAEQQATGGVTWKEIILPGNRIRVGLGILIMCCQQFSGTNAIGYYAPQIFEAVGVNSNSTGLFATGLYGVVKMIMTFLLQIFAIEKLGRKRCFMGGAFLMGVFMLIIGCLLKTHPPSTSGDSLSGASVVMVLCIYLYVTAYCFSWGPVPWIYCSEIYPNRIREYCVALAAASQWLFNFVVTEFSPYALNSIKWGIFILFAGFNFANMVISFWIPETTGKTLEEMDELFGAKFAVDTQAIREKAEIAHVERAGEEL